ncbi:MAG: D-alanyl-D-alanine carboxypeptidase, partial [Anaerotignum sp.]|nr:D-alanyl-D-alanine carboxypeptidase [Anaerotignum sp.]
MKRILSVLLLFLLSAATVFGAEPNVAAQGAALIDGKTGRLLWGQNAEEPMAMASTTKIMTAILVLENCDLGEIVTVSKNAAHQPEVHMELKEGEEWKAGDLLSAMMLRSYNDAAVALAEHVSGTVEDFCEEMTEKAKE